MVVFKHRQQGLGVKQTPHIYTSYTGENTLINTIGFIGFEQTLAQCWQLAENSTYTVGRVHGDNRPSIGIQAGLDGSVSRRHATIVAVTLGDIRWLELTPKFATVLHHPNGDRVTCKAGTAYKLFHGTRISIGNINLLYWQPDSETLVPSKYRMRTEAQPLVETPDVTEIEPSDDQPHPPEGIMEKVKSKAKKIKL